MRYKKIENYRYIVKAHQNYILIGIDFAHFDPMSHRQIISSNSANVANELKNYFC